MTSTRQDCSLHTRRSSREACAACQRQHECTSTTPWCHLAHLASQQYLSDETAMIFVALADLQEALATVKEVAAEHGRQRDDGGLSCPVNVAIVVTATA
jgi:hypothetical protein